MEFNLINGDCVDEIKKLADGSVHLTIFSPPFADLYCYSDDQRDMGNAKNYEEFFQHFSFLTPELYRTIKAGRIVSGMLIKNFQEQGFIYHSRCTIWKDPVVEMQRTKSLGLLHKQIKKDSTMSRVGIPDYILCFRKDGDNLEPVANTDMPVDLWQKYASPVWMDIDYGDTLQYRSARDNNDEKHICPLQLPTIERLIRLYSNEGDLVLDPFSGIASVGSKALEMNRRFIGFELKKSYFDQSMKNLKAAVKVKEQMGLEV